MGSASSSVGSTWGEISQSQPQASLLTPACKFPAISGAWLLPPPQTQSLGQPGSTLGGDGGQRAASQAHTQGRGAPGRDARHSPNGNTSRCPSPLLRVEKHTINKQERKKEWREEQKGEWFQRGYGERERKGEKGREKEESEGRVGKREERGREGEGRRERRAQRHRRGCPPRGRPGVAGWGRL